MPSSFDRAQRAYDNMEPPDDEPEDDYDEDGGDEPEPEDEFDDDEPRDIND